MATLILGETETTTLDSRDPSNVELIPSFPLLQTPQQSRAEQLRQQALELAREAERQSHGAQRWGVFLSFYDAFFSAVSPFYNLTLASMQREKMITASQVKDLRCPDNDFEKWARGVGLVAGIGIGLYAGGKTIEAGRPAVLGSRSFWFTPARTLPASQWIRALPNHGIWGTFNAYFRLGSINIRVTYSHAAAFGTAKSILGQIFAAIRRGES